MAKRIAISVIDDSNRRRHLKKGPLTRMALPVQPKKLPHCCLPTTGPLLVLQGKSGVPTVPGRQPHQQRVHVAGVLR